MNPTYGHVWRLPSPWTPPVPITNQNPGSAPAITPVEITLVGDRGRREWRTCPRSLRCTARVAVEPATSRSRVRRAAVQPSVNLRRALSRSIAEVARRQHVVWCAPHPPTLHHPRRRWAAADAGRLRCFYSGDNTTARADVLAFLVISPHVYIHRRPSVGP